MSCWQRGGRWANASRSAALRSAASTSRSAASGSSPGMSSASTASPRASCLRAALSTRPHSRRVVVASQPGSAAGSRMNASWSTSRSQTLCPTSSASAGPAGTGGRSTRSAGHTGPRLRPRPACPRPGPGRPAWLPASHRASRARPPPVRAAGPRAARGCPAWYGDGPGRTLSPWAPDLHGHLTFWRCRGRMPAAAHEPGSNMRFIKTEAAMPCVIPHTDKICGSNFFRSSCWIRGSV